MGCWEILAAELKCFNIHSMHPPDPPTHLFRPVLGQQETPPPGSNKPLWEVTSLDTRT